MKVPPGEVASLRDIVNLRELVGRPPLRRRPRLLDLFCGGGGASVGYARAGFEVVGVDVNRRALDSYPFERWEADALEVLDGDVAGLWPDTFDVIAASPPCQPHTRTKHVARAQGKETKKPDLLEPVRSRLVTLGVPYIIENVEGAPLRDPIRLCGSTFGLKVRRHRLFESSALLLGNGACRHKEQGKPVGVYHRMNDTVQGRNHATGEWVVGGSTARTLEEGQEAMGIDWLPWDLLREAIPPAYTEHLGRQMVAHLVRRDEGIFT